jgi:cyanophycinase
VSGPLALVGGSEFQPGNEETDRALLAAVSGGPAFVLPTAAARQRPELAIATARRWFAGLGAEVEELPVLAPGDASSAVLAERARAGRFFYLTGGDPGLVVRVLSGSPVWRAIHEAWRDGAALAGSSAGAMALGEWALLREAWPNHQRRRFAPAFGVVPNVAVVPHADTAGGRWRMTPPREDAIVLGVDERTAALWDGRGWRAVGRGRVTLTVGPEGAVRVQGDAIEGLPDPA